MNQQMKHHILVPVDFSPVTDDQIAYVATWVTNPQQTRISLYHTIPMPAPVFFDDVPVQYMEPPLKPFEERLAGFATELRETLPGVEVACQIQTGMPHVCLRQLLQEGGYDEVVIGSHGHGALFNFVFGSVAAAILKHATCPVHVLPSDAESNAQNGKGPVVACVDLSETTMHVLETAAFSAEKTGREVFAIYAEPGPEAFLITGYTHLDLWSEERLQVLERALENRCREVSATTGVAFETVVRFGPPAATLRNEIDDIGPSLVVLGAHRKGAVHDLILGSVSRKLLKHAKVPVLVANVEDQDLEDATHEFSTNQERAPIPTPY